MTAPQLQRTFEWYRTVVLEGGAVGLGQVEIAPGLGLHRAAQRRRDLAEVDLDVGADPLELSVRQDRDEHAAEGADDDRVRGGRALRDLD